MVKGGSELGEMLIANFLPFPQCVGHLISSHTRTQFSGYTSAHTELNLFASRAFFFFFLPTLEAQLSLGSKNPPCLCMVPFDGCSLLSIIVLFVLFLGLGIESRVSRRGSTTKATLSPYCWVQWLPAIRG